MASNTSNTTGTSMNSEHDFKLPAAFRAPRSHTLTLPSNDIEAFINSDVAVDRIEDIRDWLWLCGRPYLPRPLNVQVVMNRTIVATTDANFHLVWARGRIFLKPLPSYFFTNQFYDQHLQGDNINGPALGLLHTYLALVPTELDFALAKKADLFKENYDWEEWKTLTRRLFTDYPDNSIYQYLPRRYVYGELRFGRLNKVYRYWGGDWLHGYSPLMGSSLYVDWFAENLAPVAALGVYIVVVLSAMSVGLEDPELSKDGAFRRACYGFTVFSIIAPAIIIALIFGVFVIVFFANLSRTLATQKRRLKEIGLYDTENSGRDKVNGSIDLP